jgi:hypothetical protein
MLRVDERDNLIKGLFWWQSTVSSLVIIDRAMEVPPSTARFRDGKLIE